MVERAYRIGSPWDVEVFANTLSEIVPILSTITSDGSYT